MYSWTHSGEFKCSFDEESFRLTVTHPKGRFTINLETRSLQKEGPGTFESRWDGEMMYFHIGQFHAKVETEDATKFEISTELSPPWWRFWQPSEQHHLSVEKTS